MYPSLGAPSHVTTILQAEDREKVNKFEPVSLCAYLGKYQHL